MSYDQRAPVNFEQLTVSSAAVGPTTAKLTSATVGMSANNALFRSGAGDVRWRDDGTAPTATVGYLLKAGEELEYDGNLGALKFIRVSADSTLDCAYYRVD